MWCLLLKLKSKSFNLLIIFFLRFFIYELQCVIVLSCLISISVNFSTFLVIGKTSPVTYQVLGHLKTCLVLAFGYIIVRDPFNWRNILGILVAMVGMLLYSYSSILENQQKAVETTLQAAQVCFYSLAFFLGYSIWETSLWYLFIWHFQAREGELDPLINVESGNTILNKRPLVWNKEKD